MLLIQLLWWPHSKALCILLLAWICAECGGVGCQYEDVHHYTFDHFHDPKHGEWYEYLNRYGSPVWTAKAYGCSYCPHKRDYRTPTHWENTGWRHKCEQTLHLCRNFGC
ncbi:MAG: AGE family epimerase/isomerase [Pirellulales bacterium]|nr:AGE family epimerase/isomerase [Pirellulales bacterium]